VIDKLRSYGAAKAELIPALSIDRIRDETTVPEFIKNAAKAFNLTSRRQLWLFQNPSTILTRAMSSRLWWLLPFA